MRRNLVAANWKMNGSLKMARGLIGELRTLLPGAGADVMVCPPFPYLAEVARLIDGTAIRLGAQTLHTESTGAFTGEVSGMMLSDLGCSFVLVGHSERRQLFGEDDELVAAKFAAAQREGLTPVLCVGETLEEREAGNTLAVVGRQLDAVISGHGIESLSQSVLAYEPVWAIGTGRTASPEQAQEVHAALRQRVAGEIGDALRILYGGSVKAGNAAELFTQPDIDGALVGGASLDSKEFAAIYTAAG